MSQRPAEPMPVYIVMLGIGFGLLIVSWTVTNPFVGWSLTITGHAFVCLAVVSAVVTEGRRWARGRR